MKGFGARVTSTGARSFVLNYRIGGRERRLTIGSFPDWPVAAAREQAKVLKRRIDMGEDPMASRDGARTAPTVQELADRYLAEHATRKRERSAVEDASLLRQIILPAVDGGVNPRKSGDDRKSGTRIAAPDRPPGRLSIRCKRLFGGPLSTPSAAEGGGRRPAFTEGCRTVILDHQERRLVCASPRSD